MKAHLPTFFTWLGLAALADWLLTRTLTRAAIFMPKSPVMIQIYTAAGLLGQLATSLTSLLAIAALGWIAWQSLSRQRVPFLALACAALLLISLLGLFIPTAGWLALTFQASFCVALLLLVVRVWKCSLGSDFRIAITFVVLTLVVTSLNHSLNPAALLLGLPKLPVPGGILFNAGELLVLLSVAALWWSSARRASWKTWLVAALPALAFVVPRLVAPAMTGIMTIWSTGLTLILPWPVYVVALWLAGVTAIHNLRQGDAAGWALILLAAGGFAPQLSTQTFLGLIAVWLLVFAVHPAAHPTPQAIEHHSLSRAPVALPD